MCIVAMGPAHCSRHHATQLGVVSCNDYTQPCPTHRARVPGEAVVVQEEDKQLANKVSAHGKKQALVNASILWVRTSLQ